VTLGTGGSTSKNGGNLEITREQRDALVADACADLSFEPDARPPIGLELVIDVSASMNEPAPFGNGLSKWELTREALLEAVVGVAGAGLPEWFEVGLLFYPSANVSQVGAGQGGCGVANGPVPRAPLGPVGSAQRALLAERLRSVVPTGASPTVEAYEVGLRQGLLAKAHLGKDYMLVVTDGAPTVAECNASDTILSPIDAQPIVSQIDDAFAHQGVATFIVGSFGSEANRSWLSQAAALGGTAKPGCSVEAGTCHFDLATLPDFSATLNSSLTPIVGSLLSCTLPLPLPPTSGEPDPAQLYVLLGSTRGPSPQSWLLVLEDGPGDCTRGWQRVEDGVRLCPDTCEQARELGAEIVSPCAPITK
jgi:hypothetical protein